MEEKWLSYMSSGLAVVFILYIIPMFFLDTFFLYFRKDIYVLIGVLLSFLLYICSWKEFNRIREKDTMFKNFKFSFISNLLFFTFFLSIPLLSPYSEEEEHYIPYFSLLFFTLSVVFSVSLSKHFKPVKGYFITMIIFCSFSLLLLTQASLKFITIFLISLAYFIASILDVRRNRFPYFLALEYSEKGE
jgi:MFS family permease